MSDFISITLNNGKHTIRQTESGKWEALRHGEEWPAFRESGPDNLHIALAYEVDRLRNEKSALEAARDFISDWLVEGTEDLPDDTPVTVKIGARSIILDELKNLRAAARGAAA